MNTLTVADVAVRQDAAGRYSLNDLHRAAGGEDRHQPGMWLRLGSTMALCEEWLQSADLQTGTAPVLAVNGGPERGTYAVRELVYAYAMWISPAFHLRVIRAYDALVSARLSSQRTPVTEVDEDWQRASKIRAAKTTFIAILQATRAMGIHHARGLTSANNAAIRHHGVDMIAEAEAQDRLLPDAHAAATPMNSIGAFLMALESGEFAGVELQPALSRDVYGLYAEWCRRRGDFAAPVPRFVHQLERAGIRSKRLRYFLEGAFHGPHGVLLVGIHESPPHGSQAQWYGAAIGRFRDQAAAWSGAAIAEARAA